MRREIGILIILFSVFLAIGCTGNNNEEDADEVVSPAAIPVDTPVAPAGTPQPISEGKIVDVAIEGFAFTPSSIEVSTGDTVRWTNMDSDYHTVSGPTFTSGNISKGQSYKFLFNEPGVYNYICSIHPSMKGTVIVVDKE